MLWELAVEAPPETYQLTSYPSTTFATDTCHNKFAKPQSVIWSQFSKKTFPARCLGNNAINHRDVIATSCIRTHTPQKSYSQSKQLYNYLYIQMDKEWKKLEICHPFLKICRNVSQRTCFYKPTVQKDIYKKVLLPPSVPKRKCLSFKEFCYINNSDGFQGQRNIHQARNV